MRNIFSILIYLGSLSILGFAQVENDGSTLWRQGQQDYEQGNFSEAVKHFEKLQQENPANGHVLFNLGNAYYKNNQKGAAVAAYIAGQRLLPRDPDIRANLNFVAKSLNINPDLQIKEGIGHLLFPHRTIFNDREHGWLLVGLLTILLTGIGVYSWKMQKAVGIFVLTMLFLVVYQGSATTLAFKDRHDAVGAITTTRVTAYAGPQRDGAFPEVFQLQEGYPVKVLEKRPQWIMIGLSDGRKGWLLSTDIAFF